MTTSGTQSVVLQQTTPPPPPSGKNLVRVEGIDGEEPQWMTPEEAARHVTIWNKVEGRKIAGNAAPLRKNLSSYLAKHPECEVYTGQDQEIKKSGGIDPRTGRRVILMNEHVPIWHRIEGRKVTGNAAPLRKNLDKYLEKHPECEVYDYQDKCPEKAAAARQRAEEAKVKAIAKAHAYAQAYAAKNGIKQNVQGKTVPRPGPIPGFAKARTVFRENVDDDDDDSKNQDHQGSNHGSNQGYRSFSKPVVALVTGPNEPSCFGPAMSPVHNRLDYKGAFGMYRNTDAAHAEPSWQDMSRSWSNTPAWTIMASRSHVAGANASTPFSPMTTAPRNKECIMTDASPITPSEQQTTLSAMQSPKGIMMSPKGDILMGSSLSSSPGSTPLSPDVPMLGPTGFLTPSVATAMECSPPEANPTAMAFSPSNFFIENPAGFSMGRT